MIIWFSDKYDKISWTTYSCKSPSRWIVPVVARLPQIITSTVQRDYYKKKEEKYILDDSCEIFSRIIWGTQLNVKILCNKKARARSV